jgi:cell wall-associated NlpC family hydrolase
MALQPVLDYIKTLVGTPYIWWKDGQSTLDTLQPFYATPDEDVPSIENIKRLGTNCAGFINLICRNFGAPIPGVSERDYYAGGTPAWYESLNARGKLHLIDTMKIYPIGTLLLAQYIDPEWQGHVAIVTSPGTIKTCKISHSFPEIGVVMDEPVGLTHELVESGYYTTSANIEDWLPGYEVSKHLRPQP